MKVVFKNQQEETVTLQQIGYGNCCRLQNGKDIYMYVQTTQTHVSIVKHECVRKGVNTCKLLNFKSGIFSVVDQDIRVIPITAVVCVEE